MRNLNDKRVLVCIIGTLRAIEVTHQSIIQKVIRPLNADLLICVSRISSEDEKLLEYFKGVNIVDVCIYDDSVRYEDLRHKFGKSFNHNQWCKYISSEGNWLGGIDGRKGSGMYLTYNYWKLSERLKDLKSKSISYERYIITRSDLMWLAKHPPLNLLSPSCVWTPEGEDYHGYNDRHAVCSEKNIRYYLSMFEYMMDSRAVKYLKREILRIYQDIGHEKHLKYHLDSNWVMVGKFKNVSYLTGGTKTPTRWGTIKSLNLGDKIYNYKYYNELTGAIKNAEEFERYKDWSKMIFRPSFVCEMIRLLKARIRIEFRTLLFRTYRYLMKSEGKDSGNMRV
ncbi:MAG: hypothetical protein HQ547_05660 [Candidatus Omnitrophica bacterium]|nr:hypothetical protein [Candidatus Omnitrophota bacterium]